MYGWIKTKQRNVENVIEDSNFKECWPGIWIRNGRGGVIRNTVFEDNITGILAEDAFFTYEQGNSMIGGNWGIGTHGSYPLGSGVIIGEANGDENSFQGQASAAIVGAANTFPTGAFISNCDFKDQNNASTFFFGADEYNFVNNTVSNSSSGIGVFAAGNAVNIISCNQFTDISNASTSLVWHNEGTLILENHFEGNQNVNMGFAGSAVADHQGFNGESASNCFSGPTEDINSMFFLVPNGSFDYKYYNDVDAGCEHEPFNNGSYTKNEASNIGDYCGGVIGVFNLIDPTGGGGSSSNIPDIRPESVLPDGDPDPNGPPVQPPSTPTGPAVVCIPCLLDYIDNSITDVVAAGGDDPTTIPIEGGSNGNSTQSAANLPLLEATMNQWISFGLYVSLMTDNFSIGEQILTPLQTWEWRTKHFGFNIQKNDLTKAEIILNNLNPISTNEIQFVKVQRTNLKRFRNESISQVDIDELYQIANDRFPSRGYAKTLYEDLTKIKLPINIPDFTEGTKPRSQSMSEKTTIYPNPFTDILNINVVNKEVQEVSIYNQVGKKVYSGESNYSKMGIDMSGNNAGIYIMLLKLSDGTSEVRKIIKL